jgi:uncharacterized protein YoxC
MEETMIQGTHRPETRNWQSVRVILEGLILAGILWSINNQTDQTRAIVRLQTQIEGMQQANTGVIAAIPAISNDVATMKVRIDDTARRVTDLEQLRRLR